MKALGETIELRKLQSQSNKREVKQQRMRIPRIKTLTCSSMVTAMIADMFFLGAGEAVR